MVASMKTYHVDVTRDGKFWLIRIPEIGRSTQAIRYKDVAPMAGELVEIMTGLASQDYNLEIRVQLPNDVQDHRARAEALRDEAKRKFAEAAAESRAAVQELIALGLSQREAGEVLGLSFQRVNQLVNS
jgi:DNA-directed RNA polymerase specialized sigma24 family protein